MGGATRICQGYFLPSMEGKVTRVGVSKPGGERVSISQLRILIDQRFLILILTFYFLRTCKNEKYILRL